LAGFPQPIHLSYLKIHLSAEIDFLGKFFVRNFRNTAMECVQGLCREKFDSPGQREYQKLISTLSDEQKEVLQKVVRYCVEGALNDTLYRLDLELNKKKPRIQIQVDGKSLANTGAPPALHSRLWGQTGWLNRY
jgi:hypothetical protein